MIKLGNTNDLQEFHKLISNFEKNETICEMKQYRHHYTTNCYEHCTHVAFYTYLLCKKYHLDYISAVRAAMVHDLFLYDWRIKSEKSPRLHGFRHPRISLNNAEKLFDLSPKEKDIILKHMWPITFFLPRYKESYIVSFADKMATMQETIDYYKHNLKIQKLYRYGYVFLSLLIFRIF